ncbi:m-phase inducer phosphatase [Coemansia interrupta]|uniref:M-phase inducer phosphatase n=1 Tax=Coemansia interrupta TaxID=1126814 RepID=A0A9W8LMY0_9FUNG|nr:m-phase inducer phosphatase [Coemansia interrupta]
MNTTVAPDHPSSSYIRGLSTPNPFIEGLSTPCKTASSDKTRHSAKSDAGSETSQTNTTAVSRSGSPIASLVKDIQSSLNLKSTIRLDRDKVKPPPSFQPYKCQSPYQPTVPRTPIMTASRKRTRDELTSPGLGLTSASPTTMFWSRNRGRKPRGSILGATPGGGLFSRESQQQMADEADGDDDDDTVSLDADDLLSIAPRVRSSSLRNYTLTQPDLAGTPSRPQGSGSGRAKRIRSSSKGIPTFLPIQEEGDLEKTPPRRLAHSTLTPASIFHTPLAASSSSGTRLDSAEAIAAAATPQTLGCQAKPQTDSHQLPCSPASSDSIMRIEAKTASDLLDGVYDYLFDEKIFVDCRFPYEYEGGHIAGATNAPTQEALEQLLLNRPLASDKRVVVVLHCEYSIQRAPSMASLLRKRDREINMHRYPLLNYPEVYVLKGGYRNFFGSFKTQCEPQNYVEMNDEAFAVDCKQRMMQFNRQFKRTKSMTDASLGGRTRSLTALAQGAQGPLFGNGSPTPMMGQGRSISTSNLPPRPRRMARTQSAMPGVSSIDFSLYKL